MSFDEGLVKFTDERIREEQLAHEAMLAAVAAVDGDADAESTRRARLSACEPESGLARDLDNDHAPLLPRRLR